MQAIDRAFDARARAVVVLLLAAAIVLGLLARSAAASTAYSAASANPQPIPWTGWNGRPIQRPHKPVSRALLSKAAYPAGWSAGAVGYGTGYHAIGGSERVREVQRRLTRLGYHTGPIDGLYGPLTRSSVQWFQIKHGLRPTGVVAATTLAALSDPKGFAHDITAQAKENPAQPGQTPTTGAGPGAAPPAPTSEHPQAASSHGNAPSWLMVAFDVLLAAAVGLLLIGLVRALRKASEPREEAPIAAAKKLKAAPPPKPRAADSVALGYVRADSEASLQAHGTAIKDACARRGWHLKQIVREARLTKDKGLALPGLSYALEQLGEGGASRLVVDRLEHVASSMPELNTVLRWFTKSGVALTALDVDLDTSTPEGRAAARIAMSLATHEQERVADRTRRDLEAAWASRRPRATNPPQIAARIRSMRSSGLTLHTIAEILNDEGIPADRRGGRWRPSSVQSLLGNGREESPRTNR